MDNQETINLINRIMAKQTEETLRKVHELARYRTAVKVGTVIQQNYDGTYEIALAGSAFPHSRVRTQLSTDLNPGEGVVLQYENSDSSQPRIIGRTPSRTGFSSSEGSV